MKRRHQTLVRNIHALYFALQSPQVPRAARVLGTLVLAYALSPIDLIPDFIPVLGLVDDLLLLPLGIWLALKLIPDEAWRDCQAQAARAESGPPACAWGAALVIGGWLTAVLIIGWLVLP